MRKNSRFSRVIRLIRLLAHKGEARITFLEVCRYDFMLGSPKNPKGYDIYRMGKSKAENMLRKYQSDYNLNNF